MRPLGRNILWLAVVAVLVGPAIAVRLSGTRAPAGSPVPPAVIPRPSSPSGQVSRLAPDFTLKTFEGRRLSLSEFRAKVVVLNFWASWCTPCKEEMPILERAWQTFKGNGVVVLGIDIEDDPDSAVAFLKALGITYGNIYDSEQARITAYQVTALPTTIFIDRRMHIRARFVGGYQGPAGYQELHKQIFALLSSSP